MDISVIGLGKLGLCTAACFAARGHKVVGVDADAALLAALRRRECPIAESGLEELLRRAGDNFSCSGDYAAAVAASAVTMIIVPTPSLEDGSFSNAFVLRALEQLAPALAGKKEFHVVNVVSTVMPGSCAKVFIPLLERLTGKICGQEFGFVYNPEFIALGSVIRDFLRPDMLLMGVSDARSAAILREIYAATVESAPVYAVMSPLNAELTKLSLNCFVTMKINFANELAALCEAMPGADVDVVTRAVGSDSRVGSKYLTGGLGFGGPCFPRDNLAMSALGRLAGHEWKLAPLVLEQNKAVPERIFNRLRARLSPGGPVALFGVSYKQDTPVVEESQGLRLAGLLARAGYAVRLHDPLALDTARAVMGDGDGGGVSYHSSPYTAAHGARAIALLADWAQFAAYDWARLEQEAAPDALLFDSWRRLRDREFKRLVYCPLGLGEE
ncbi:MAG: nucleotide sugar dehydrogenase [Deltaproteobacteria bacterium]|jgi:UDPglucose 6-dehydrogenase|nr:nucleotide sugar dehydrogenase [Deltaproteobacteria bacterium]